MKIAERGVLKRTHLGRGKMIIKKFSDIKTADGAIVATCKQPDRAVQYEKTPA